MEHRRSTSATPAPRRGLLATLAVVLVALTACGTTVPGATSAAGGTLAPAAGTAGAPGATTDGGISTGATTATGAGPVAAGGGQLASGGAAGGGTARSPVAGGGTTTRAGSTAGVQSGPVDHSPVRVGFEVLKGGNAAISAAFGTPVNFGDGRAEVMAIVKDVNAHGGVGGRQIIPVIAEWNVQDKDAGRESTCRAMTEDGHVAFIVTVINIVEVFVQCAAKHGVPVINASFGAGDVTLYQRYGDILYSPSLMNLNREESLVMSTLHAQGKLTSSTKTGVIIDGTGDPMYDRVYATTVDPQLKAWGVPHQTYSVKEQADVSGAVLKFQSDGVQTVLFIAPSGVIEVLFMQAAEQQRYRPVYGLGDSAAAWFVGNASPRAQAKMIRGAGSLPISNVDVSQYPTTPLEKQCLDLIRQGGENNADRHSSITATVYCEAIREFDAIGERVTGKLDRQSFRAAFATLGTSYKPVTTFSVDFGTGRNDNASAYRLLGWSDSCTCVTYTSPLRPLPR